MLDLCIKFQK